MKIPIDKEQAVFGHWDRGRMRLGRANSKSNLLPAAYSPGEFQELIQAPATQDMVLESALSKSFRGK